MYKLGINIVLVLLCLYSYAQVINVNYSTHDRIESISSNNEFVIFYTYDPNGNILSKTIHLLQPHLTLSDTAYTFGDCNLDSTRTILLQNTGDADLIIDSLSALSYPFTYTYSWPDTLAPGELDTLVVQVNRPDTNGVFEDTLWVYNNDTVRCVALGSVEPVEGVEVAFEVTPTTCGDAVGAVDLEVLTGTPPITFTWSNGETGEDVSNLAEDTYDVGIEDANQCQQDLSIAVPSNCVPPFTKFQKTYHDSVPIMARAIIQTMDGGYAVAGHTFYNNTQSDDAFLMKLDGDGTVLWSKYFGGPGNEQAWDIIETNDQGFLLVGFTDSYGVGAQDVYTIRTKSNGDLIWAKHFGGVHTEYGRSVCRADNNSYLMAGYVTTAGAGLQDAYILKIDDDGNLIWAKGYGGPRLEIANDILPTSDDNFIVVGYTQSYGDLSENGMVIKIDNDGNVIWNKFIESPNQEQFEAAAETADGDYVITGFSSGFSGAGGNDVFTVKLSKNGAYQWSSLYGGSNQDEARDIDIMPSGKILLGGFISNNQDNNGVGAYLLCLNPDGSKNWSKAYGGPQNDYAFALTPTSDLGFNLAGFTIHSNSRDMLLIKIDTLGNSGCNETEGIAYTQIASPNVFQDSLVVTSIGVGGDQLTTSILSQVMADTVCLCNLTITVNAIENTCPGTQNGSIDIGVNGGTTPYTYLWDGGETSEDIANLVAQPYSVFITDDANCEFQSATFSVEDHAIPSVSIQSPQNLSSSQWVLPFKGHQEVYVNDMEVDDDNNVYVCGWFKYSLLLPHDTLYTEGEEDCFVAKFDYQGNVVWSKHFGGVGEDHLPNISIGGDGSVIGIGDFRTSLSIDGFTVSATTSSPSESDIFVFRINGNGMVDLLQSAGGPNDESGYDIETDGLGNIFFTATFEDNAQFGNQVYAANPNIANTVVAKLDPAGNYLWSKRTHSTTGDFEVAERITLDNQNNIYVAGSFNSTFYLDNSNFQLTNSGLNNGFVAKISNNGNVAWLAHLASNDNLSASSIITNPAGQLFVTGKNRGTMTVGSQSVSSTIYSDIYLLALDTSGTAQWLKQFPGYLDNDGDDVFWANNKLYTTGTYAGIIDIEQIQLSANSNSSNFYLAQFDGTGNLIKAQNFGGNNTESGHRVRANGQYTYVGGSFHTTWEVADTIIYSGKNSGFVWKFSDGNVGVKPCYGDTIDLFVGAEGAPIWSTGETSDTIEVIASGAYTVEVTNQFGCINSDTFMISSPPELAVTFNIGEITCYGGADGTVEANASGGTSPYQYLWADGSTTKELSGLSSGTYVVVVTDTNGCTKVDSVTIQNPQSFTVSFTVSDTQTCLQDTVHFVNTSSGNLIFEWKVNGVIQNMASQVFHFVSASAGTYQVELSASDGVCIITKSQYIVVHDLPEITFQSCQEATWAQLGDYGSEGKIGAVGFVIGANGYIQGGHDGNGFTTDLWQYHPIIDTWIRKADMPGMGRGEAAGFAVGGKAYVGTGSLATGSDSRDFWEYDPLSNSWAQVADLPGGGRTNAIGFSIGNKGYVGLGRNYQNNIHFTNFFEYDPIQDVWLQKAPFPGDGKLNAVGFSIGNKGFVGLGETNGIPGTKEFWEYDPATDQWTQKTDFPGSSRNSVTGFSIGNKGYIIAGADPGFKKDVWEYDPATDSWNQKNDFSGPERSNAVGFEINGIGYFGTGANTGLPLQDLWQFKPCTPDQTTAQHVYCYNASDGSAAIQVISGNAPYTYLWNTTPTQTDSIATNLSQGDYMVEVTDANGCVALDTITINQPDSIEIQLTGTNITCNGGSDGSIATIVTGGTPPYSFTWTDGSTTQNPQNLIAGTYILTLTDANNCQATQSITLTEPPPLTGSIISTNPTCFASNDGITTYDITSGGQLPLTFLWNTGATTQSIINLAPDTYSVTATDANGCNITASTAITEPPLLEITTITSPTFAGGWNISCKDETNGTINIVVQGGTIPYAYQWSNGSTTKDLSQLGAGTYTVMVTDANGCQDTASITLTEPDSLLFTLGKSSFACGYEITCAGANDGEIYVTAISGGTAPYQYSWSNGAIIKDISDLGEGSYTLTATDANGCTYTQSTVLDEPDSLTGNITSPVFACSTNVSCNGGGDGSATVTVSGGCPPYNYQWDNGQTTPTAMGLLSGHHQVLVTDQNGCTYAAFITLSEPDPLTVSLGSPTYNCGYHISCHEASDGSINISITGGASCEPYQLNWIGPNGFNAQQTQTAIGNLTGLKAGQYDLVVSDDNNCQVTATVFLTEPDPLMVSMIATADTIDCLPLDVEITADPTGGCPAYQYLWSTGETAQTITVNPNLTTTYTVQVTDANNCLAGPAEGGSFELVVINRCGNNTQKSLICHIPNGNNQNPQTICISPNALQAHLDQLGGLHGGDFCGPCQGAAKLLAQSGIRLLDDVQFEVFPNPFNDRTQIMFTAPQTGALRLSLFDVSGRELKVLMDATVQQGEMHYLEMDGKDLVAGVYFLRLRVGNGMMVEKLVKIK